MLLVMIALGCRVAWTVLFIVGFKIRHYFIPTGHAGNYIFGLIGVVPELVIWIGVGQMVKHILRAINRAGNWLLNIKDDDDET